MYIEYTLNTHQNIAKHGAIMETLVIRGNIRLSNIKQYQAKLYEAKHYTEGRQPSVLQLLTLFSMKSQILVSKNATFPQHCKNVNTKIF